MDDFIVIRMCLQSNNYSSQTGLSKGILTHILGRHRVDRPQGTLDPGNPMMCVTCHLHPSSSAYLWSMEFPGSSLQVAGRITQTIVLAKTRAVPV